MGQVGSVNILCLITALQSTIYAVICSILGCRIAKSIGLVHSLRIEKNSLLHTLAVTLGGGVFSLLWIIGHSEDGCRRWQKAMKAVCFVLNGRLDLLFERLYQKYGIWYAIIGHAGVHVILKVIWLLLV